MIVHGMESNFSRSGALIKVRRFEELCSGGSLSTLSYCTNLMPSDANAGEKVRPIQFDQTI